MRIRLPIMIQDPKLSGHEHLKRIVERPYLNEDVFTDGPACARVAVRDITPTTGEPPPQVPFLPPSGGRKLGRYQIADEKDIYAADFMAVSAFGTVLRTIHMFEEEDTLGRPLAWAFEEPQLLIVPRAGEKANASYDRATRSLKFYYFANPLDPAHKVYTALSRDIVCHETGHAILDGITPRLLYPITPQAFALHESIADLVAVVMSFRSGNLREAILKETKGSIADVGAFSSIGEEFGQALHNLDCLRDLRSPLRINDVSPSDGYALSQVLSAALYKMIIGMHERWWQKLSGEGAALDYSLSGKALAIAVEHFKRMIFRALDYLPPAEVSFADYGRAIIAADQASHPEPEDDEERDFIRQEFFERGIITDPKALEVETDFEHPAMKELDLETLVRRRRGRRRLRRPQPRPTPHPVRRPLPRGTPIGCHQALLPPGRPEAAGPRVPVQGLVEAAPDKRRHHPGDRLEDAAGACVVDLRPQRGLRKPKRSVPPATPCCGAWSRQVSYRLMPRPRHKSQCLKTSCDSGF